MRVGACEWRAGRERERRTHSGYAQQPGTESGASASRNLFAVCKLENQLCEPALMSPEVRYQLKGHQSAVGHEESSELVQRPQ